MMNIRKIILIALGVALGAPAIANDAHHDDHAAPVAKDAHAAAPQKDAHAAPAAPEKKDDARAAPAVPDSATAAKDEASAKPARKPKRKKAKAEAKHAADSHRADAAHGDAHAAPVPPTIAPTSRVRTRDRASAAAAVAAAQASNDHGAAAPAAASPSHDEHASHDAAPAAAAPTAQAAPAAAADAHDDHAANSAPAVPATIEPTRRSRVKSSLRAAPTPAVAAADAAHDAAPAAAAQDMHDSHGMPAAADAHAAHDKPAPVQAANAAPAAPQDASMNVAPVEPVASADECNPPLKAEIAALFDRWNASLRTGDPKKVVANYAPESILLPTVSNRARFTVAEKEDYFMHFLQRRPQGYIDDRIIDVDCNSATDAGLYTFRFADGGSVKARYSFSYKKINGQWLITSHHSSGMPEKPEAPVAHAAEPQPQAVTKAVESGVQNKGWVRFP